MTFINSCISALAKNVFYGRRDKQQIFSIIVHCSFQIFNPGYSDAYFTTFSANIIRSICEKETKLCEHWQFSIKNTSTHLTLFPPKTNIFVHGKNCTFSKKGMGHKCRCYSVCIDDTCKCISHILSRIIGPLNTATKIRVPILDNGHMAQISTANPEIWSTFMCVHANSCMFMQSLFVFMQNLCMFMQIYACSCKIYSCSCKIYVWIFEVAV